MVSLAFFAAAMCWTYQKLNIGSLLAEKNNFGCIDMYFWPVYKRIAESERQAETGQSELEKQAGSSW